MGRRVGVGIGTELGVVTELGTGISVGVSWGRHAFGGNIVSMTLLSEQPASAAPARHMQSTRQSIRSFIRYTSDTFRHIDARDSGKLPKA